MPRRDPPTLSCVVVHPGGTYRPGTPLHRLPPALLEELVEIGVVHADDARAAKRGKGKGKASKEG